MEPEKRQSDRGNPAIEEVPTIRVTYSELRAALEASLLYKQGTKPVVGQADDLWKRLGGV